MHQFDKNLKPIKAKQNKSSCKMKPLRSKVKVKSLKMNKNVSNRKDKVVSDLISDILKNKKGCRNHRMYHMFTQK